MTPEQAAQLDVQLDALEAFIRGFQRTGRTCRQFWDEFHARAEGLHAAAMDGEALADRYFDLLDSAHQAFPAAPDTMDDVME